MLSNALNSDDKADEKAAETTLVTETTLSTLPPSVAVETSAADTSTAAAATTNVVADTSVAIAEPSNIPVQQVAVSSVIGQPAAEVKAAEKIAETVVTTAANATESDGVINKLSANVIVLSLVASCWVFTRI